MFYLSDANYNVTGLVKYDSQSQTWGVAERYTYTPYGVVTYRNPDWTTAGSSANSNSILYTGRTLDLLTSLYYYRARYYDAGLERFITTDPIRYDAGDFNLYRYCGNVPTSLSDPTGKDWLDCMASCVEDNDPLPYALGAAAKAILASGGWQSKTALAQVANMLGDEKLAEAIMKSMKMPGASSVSDLTSFIVAVKRAGGTKAGQAFRMLGSKAAAILGPIETAYGLALAAIEVHCLGWCCTASFYGIPYNHTDGNIIDAWQQYYFPDRPAASPPTTPTRPHTPVPPPPDNYDDFEHLPGPGYWYTPPANCGDPHPHSIWIPTPSPPDPDEIVPYPNGPATSVDLEVIADAVALRIAPRRQRPADGVRLTDGRLATI